MKLAYCFVGHVRTYKQTYQNFFRNVFSQAPGDIFIHTWSETSNVNNSWWVDMQGNRKFIEDARKPVNIQEIIDIYKPKEILVEPQRSLLPVPGWEKQKHDAYALKIIYESLRKSVNMAIKHGPYDRIFTQRMDMNCLTKFDPKELNSDRLFVAPHSQFLDMGACSDIWGHGTQRQMDIWANFYWRIEELVYFANNKSVHGELAFHRYLKSHNIPISVSKLNFQIIRMFGYPPLQFEPRYFYTGTAN